MIALEKFCGLTVEFAQQSMNLTFAKLYEVFMALTNFVSDLLTTATPFASIGYTWLWLSIPFLFWLCIVIHFYERELNLLHDGCRVKDVNRVQKRLAKGLLKESELEPFWKERFKVTERMQTSFNYYALRMFLIYALVALVIVSFNLKTVMEVISGVL